MHALPDEGEVLTRVDPEPTETDSALNVIVPAFPEIATYGKTVEHALEMARNTIELSLAYHRDAGLEIPVSDDAARLERVVVQIPAA